VPAAAVLITEGFQVPGIDGLFVELVGKAGAVELMQSRAIAANVGVTAAFTVITETALLPVTTGAVETTLIRYPEPAAVPDGMTPAILPEFAVDVEDPISTGDEKLPEELDNSIL